MWSVYHTALRSCSVLITSEPPSCPTKNSCVCILTSRCSGPLPATDKTAASWPTVIKLGSVVGAAVPGCRHGGSKATALLLTGLYFPPWCGQLDTAAIKRRWNTTFGRRCLLEQLAGAHTLIVHTHTWTDGH